MGAIANITVYDGAATPVIHTLVPVSVTREKGEVVAVWREQIASLPSEAQVCLTARQKLLASGVTRTAFRMEVPVMESVSGQNSAGYTAAPKVAYIDADEWISYSHPRATITGRRLSRQLLVNLANNITTSVAAASSGPLPEAVDTLVMPT